MATKAKGEWSHEVVGEWKQSEAVVWKAQVSKSPEGKTLLGVRKFIVRADGNEIVTKDGFNLPQDNILENVEGLTGLLNTLTDTSTPKKGKKSSSSKSNQKLVLYKKATDRYLVNVVDGVIKVSAKKTSAKVFDDSTEVEEFLFEEGGDLPALKHFKPINA